MSDMPGAVYSDSIEITFLQLTRLSPACYVSINRNIGRLTGPRAEGLNMQSRQEIIPKGARKCPPESY